MTSKDEFEALRPKLNPDDHIAREEFVKSYILGNKHIFGNLGDATVVFEKAIHKYSIIVDCLIFSELKGIIGIEIKTKNDSLKRLNKQLLAYRAVSDFAWVLCHDKHIEKVEEIINKNGHEGVGIMSYTEFEDSLVVGVIKDANTSPHKSAQVVLDMLWKSELASILSPIRSGLDVFEWLKDSGKLGNSYGGSGGLKNYGASVTGASRKNVIIAFIISYLGKANASQLVCDMFRLGIMDASKVIKRHHFRVIPEEEQAKGVNFYGKEGETE